MSKELIVSSTAHETKVAIIEDDQVVEVYFEREQEYSLAGSIFKGRVTRVLPGMQSSFVNIGLERDAFLYVSDFFEDTDEYDALVSATEEKVARLERDGRLDSADSPAVLSAGASAAAAPVVSGDSAIDSVVTETPADAVVGEGVVPVTLPGEVRQASGGAPARHEGERPERGNDRGNDRGGDRGGDRGDRHRRNRRRRGRGRSGFPESKYAGGDRGGDRGDHGPRPVPYSPSPLAPVAREAADETSSEAPSAPIILPGESLAKYRGVAPSPIAHEFREETHGESGAEAAAHEESAEFEPIADGAEIEIIAEESVLHEAIVTAPESHASHVEVVEVHDVALAESEAAVEEIASEDAEPIEPLASGESAAEMEAESEAEATEDAPDGEGESESASEGESSEESTDGTGEMEAAAGGEPESPADAVATVRGPAPERERRFNSRRNRRRGRDNRDNRPPNQNRQPERGGQRFGSGGQQPQEHSHEHRPTRNQPLIGELLHEGQEIIVQIAKEPIGKKGARITSHIALPGRYLVYMPTVDHVGVSRRISSDEERQRLKRVLTEFRRGVNMPGGFIVRTAAEGHSDEDLRADMRFLFNLWKECRSQAEKKSAPALLHRDLNLVERILRDQVSSNFTTIWVDDEAQYTKIVEFVNLSQPSLAGRVKLYGKETPIFEEFGVQEQINNAMKSKVWLKSGGYIVINQTEALVAIDVNTGKYVGKTQRLEDTIVKTNVDAIKEIVRQIRLRDLGGIIVIDFIDMDERKNRQRVMQALEEALRKDRAPSKALQFNDFGLVAITRKRVKQPLEKALGCACPYCTGSGFVKSAQTVSLEILAEARKMILTGSIERNNITIRVNPDVARALKQSGVAIISEIEELAKKPVIVKGDVNLHQENFDIH